MNKKVLKKELYSYIFINVIAMVGVSCYILADTFFISKGVGSNGLTALNLAIPIFSIITATGLMLGMGGATKYNILKTQEEQDKANKHFTNTFIMALLISIIFGLLGLFLSKNITNLMGADQIVFDYTNTYIKVALIFAPAFVINNLIICYMRNDGNPKLAMTASLIGSFSNIILDYIFIFPFKMGMFGAILATGFSPIISLLVMLPYLLKGKQKFRFDFSNIKIKEMFESIKLGVPSFVVEISSGIVIVVFNTIILKLAGNIGVAAYGVITNVSLVIIAIFTGMAQGMQPVLSRSYAVNNKQEIKYILEESIALAGIVSLFIVVIVNIFATNIVSIFNSENNNLLQDIAVDGIKIYFIGMLFASLNIILSMFFTSIEKISPSYLITLLRGLLLIIPITIITSNLLDIKGVWASFPITEVLVFMIAGNLYYVINKNVLKIK